MSWPAFTWALARAAEHEALLRAEAPQGLLSPREEQLLAGLTFPARRKKWLLGRVAAKRLLLEALAASRGASPPPTAITVANEPSGAPYAELTGEGRLPWAISLSHRGDLGLCALSTEPGVLLGADLEMVEPRDPALVRTFFTAHEQATVAAEPGARAVARIWSAKESVLKALGLGLRLDTREVEIVGEARASGGPQGWTPLEVTLGPGVPPALHQAFRVAWRDEGGYVLSIALGRR
ncbi:MAG: 4'-phosphopantetheinyl transferase family protein [Myxococcaceae bacterium]